MTIQTLDKTLKPISLSKIQKTKTLFSQTNKQKLTQMQNQDTFQTLSQT